MNYLSLIIGHLQPCLYLARIKLNKKGKSFVLVTDNVMPYMVEEHLVELEQKIDVEFQSSSERAAWILGSSSQNTDVISCGRTLEPD